MDQVFGGKRFGCSRPFRRSRTAMPISRIVEGFVSSHSTSIAMKIFERDAVRDWALASFAMSSRYF